MAGRKRSKFKRHPKVGYRIGPIEWRDPFPEIMGTKPEKMVLAQLYSRKIPFFFQFDAGSLPGADVSVTYRLDFYIPSSRIVIEVNGDYWHTLGNAPFNDAVRAATLEALGCKVVVWWESDILVRLNSLFDAEPFLRNPPVLGPPISMVNTHDDLRAMRIANANRAGRTPLKYRKTSRRRKQARRGY